MLQKPSLIFFRTVSITQTTWSEFWTFFNPPPPMRTLLLNTKYHAFLGNPTPPHLSTWFVYGPLKLFLRGLVILSYLIHKNVRQAETKSLFDFLPS